MSPRLQNAVLIAAVVLMAASSAHTQTYAVTGNDVFRIGATARTTSAVAYVGTQRLTIERDGSSRRYTADALYHRTGDSGEAAIHARFVQELARDGNFQDRSDDDPDFLTILNQPFAVQLDAKTISDLRALHRGVPFQAQSPFGGSILHGFLRPRPAGRIGGTQAVGVGFEADGPMSGPMPQHPDAAITGDIRMDGTAYYSSGSALLLALDATITITGNLSQGSEEVPVKIVYKRWIRANHEPDDRNAALHGSD